MRPSPHDVLHAEPRGDRQVSVAVDLRLKSAPEILLIGAAIVVRAHVTSHGREEDPLAQKMIDHARHAITLDVRRQIENAGQLAQMPHVDMQRVRRFVGVAVEYIATLDREARLQIPGRRLQLEHPTSRRDPR